MTLPVSSRARAAFRPLGVETDRAHRSATARLGRERCSLMAALAMRLDSVAPHGSDSGSTQDFATGHVCIAPRCNVRYSRILPTHKLEREE